VFDTVVWHFSLLDHAEPDSDNDSAALIGIVRDRIAWRGTQNLYRSGTLYLAVFRQWQPILDGARTQPDWAQFWGSDPAATREGTIRYAGGDISTRAMTAPDQLTPEDFRLRPDSAGYRAGPDDKDFGADVDQVGPGEAYERWKATPDYAKWREETARLMAGSHAMIDERGDAPEKRSPNPDD
jgi:hypothetical protein